MEKIIYDPGYPLGIITAQSITQPLTQDTLSSFHKTGSKNNMIENIKKFHDLTQNINNNNNSICNVFLNKQLSNKEIYCILVYKRFFDLIKNIKKFYIEEYKIYWIKESIKNNYSNILEINIYKKYQYKYINLNNISNILIKYFYDKNKDNVLIINSPEHLSKIIILYNNNNNLFDNNFIKDIKICGIENIIDILNTKKKNNIMVRGSNLNLILSNININSIKTTSNNIKDVLDVFGIENTRYVLLKELSEICSIEHSLILADCMTVLGNVSTVNSKGFSKIDKSFLSNISYENSIKIIKNNIPFGVFEKINNTTKNIIIGNKPNIGTGIIKIYKKENVFILYFNKEDEKYINVYHNKNIIIKKSINIVFYRTYNIKKINKLNYNINSNFIDINKILITILKINKNNKNFEFNLINMNYLKITIKNFKSIQCLKCEITQGNNIFEIFTKDENILLSDNFILPDYKYEIYIKNCKKNNNIINDVNIYIKSKDKTSSKIIIV